MAQTADILPNGEGLVCRINGLYEELVRMTGKFLESAEVDLPAQEELANFEVGRRHLFVDLEPLLDQQGVWLGGLGKAKLDDATRAAVDAQLRSMKQLQELDGRLVECLNHGRNELDKSLALVRSGRRDIRSYRSGSKVAPRFYRRTV